MARLTRLRQSSWGPLAERWCSGSFSYQFLSRSCLCGHWVEDECMGQPGLLGNMCWGSRSLAGQPMLMWFTLRAGEREGNSYRARPCPVEPFHTSIERFWMVCRNTTVTNRTWRGWGREGACAGAAGPGGAGVTWNCRCTPAA